MLAGFRFSYNNDGVSTLGAISLLNLINRNIDTQSPPGGGDCGWGNCDGSAYLDFSQPTGQLPEFCLRGYAAYPNGYKTWHVGVYWFNMFNARQLISIEGGAGRREAPPNVIMAPLGTVITTFGTSFDTGSGGDNGLGSVLPDSSSYQKILLIGKTEDFPQDLFIGAVQNCPSWNYTLTNESGTTTGKLSINNTPRPKSEAAYSDGLDTNNMLFCYTITNITVPDRNIIGYVYINVNIKDSKKYAFVTDNIEGKYTDSLQNSQRVIILENNTYRIPDFTSATGYYDIVADLSDPRCSQQSCRDNLDCINIPGKKICDTIKGQCVQCILQSDCNSDQKCINNTCATNTKCTSDINCTNPLIRFF